MRKSAIFASILLIAGCGAAPIARGPVVVTSDGRVTGVETPIAKDPALTDTGSRADHAERVRRVGRRRAGERRLARW